MALKKIFVYRNIFTPTIMVSVNLMILSTMIKGKRCGSVFQFAAGYKQAPGWDHKREYPGCAYFLMYCFIFLQTPHWYYGRVGWL